MGRETMSTRRRTYTLIGYIVAAFVVVGLALGLGLGLGLHSNQAQQHADAMSTASSAAWQLQADAALANPVAVAHLKSVIQKIRDAKPMAALPSSAQPPFPIDALYTWVQGTDPAWWQAKAKAYQDHYKTPFKENARDPLRAPDGKDELYYSVHMTVKHCPWMRRIWIFTAPGHRPAWMPKAGDMTMGTGGTLVTVVHHDRVFDPECVQQPVTFNSNVIEAQIPHIARLAEHFIMFNDDFFIGRPMKWSDFFTASGVAKVHLRDVSKTLATMTSMWSQHLRNMQARVRVLSEGSAPGLVPDHVVAPLRKSVLAAVVKALKSDVCTMQPFRTKTDFPTWYVALNMEPSVPRPTHVSSKYFGSGPDFVTYMTANRHAPTLFCINQEFTPATKQELDKLLSLP